MEGFAQTVIELPVQLQVVLAGAVLYAVRRLLAGRVPESAISQIAAAVTTGLLTIIGVALGLIPLEFEAVAVAALNLLAVLLGSVVVANAYFKAQRNGFLA